jgi:hypothetical protein
MWGTVFKTTIRLLFAELATLIPTLLILNTATVVTAGNSLVLAAMIYILEQALGVIAGLPSVPSLYICVMTPLWSTIRAPYGFKFRFWWKSTLCSILYGGVILLTAYLSQKAAVAISANGFQTTIATVAPTVPPLLYGSALTFTAMIKVLVMWFDVLGVGDSDGVWLPWSPSKENIKRENWDRHRMATLQAFNFLFLNTVIGTTYVPSPTYIFATWTQNGATSGGDYGFIFEWTFAISLAMIAVLTIFTFFFSDALRELLRGFWMGGPRHHPRYKGRSERDDENVDASSLSTDDEAGDDNNDG